MEEVITWGQAHWQDVLNVVAYLIAGASIVVKLTPTLKDDNILKSVIRFIGKFVALDKYGPNG